MRIEADSVLRYPRDAVFTAYRDEMRALSEYLPNVRRMEVVDRVEDEPTVRLHSVWHGASELPANLASKLEERFLSWDDFAVWDRASWSCEWRIVPHTLRDAVRCAGRIDFVEIDGGRTRIELSGDIAIELDRVKGVPAFVAGSLGERPRASWSAPSARTCSA